MTSEPNSTKRWTDSCLQGRFSNAAYDMKNQSGEKSNLSPMLFNI